MLQTKFSNSRKYLLIVVASFSLLINSPGYAAISAGIYAGMGKAKSSTIPAKFAPYPSLLIAGLISIISTMFVLSHNKNNEHNHDQSPKFTNKNYAGTANNSPPLKMPTPLSVTMMMQPILQLLLVPSCQLL